MKFKKFYALLASEKDEDDTLVFTEDNIPIFTQDKSTVDLCLKQMKREHPSVEYFIAEYERVK